MNHPARRSGSPSFSFAFVALALALVCRSATAQVIEPNGISVPATVPASTETTLQQFFTMKGETINAVANASITPATFLPLCNFQATLVLSQSQAAAGIAWYNVPASATATPTLHTIGTPPLMLGQTIASADIRNDTNYGGGLIGFALLKSNGTAYLPVYYSEDMRNVDCTGCSMPGYWKMALSYQSTLISNSYYMAWEDWEGANSTSWHRTTGTSTTRSSHSPASPATAAASPARPDCSASAPTASPSAW